MWFNGFIAVIDMALEHLDAPLLRDHRDALILGAFREDVCYLPGAQFVFQSPSLTHFRRSNLPGGFIPYLTDGAGARAEKFMHKALREFARGHEAAAFVQLGRAAHPLIDMSCPVHAQGVAHTTDPFEWCVEAMVDELRALPVSAVSAGASAADIVEDMARFAQDFKADMTNSPWGRMLRHWHRRTPVRAALAREQARVLIPRAAASTANLFELFLQRAGANALAPAAEGLAQTTLGLEMPRGGVRTWFAQLDAFCMNHGGARHYGALLNLLARCREQLDTQVTQ